MPLLPGTLAPPFETPGLHNPNYSFATVAGRNVMLLFVDAQAHELSRQLVHKVAERRAQFDDENCSLFFVAQDMATLAALGIVESYPGLRVLLDPERRVARLFHLSEGESQDLCLPALVVLDRHLRIVLNLLQAQALEHFDATLLLLRRLSEWRARQPSLGQAPVLVVDRIFDLDLCQRLIAYYQAHGGARSGYMKDVGGRTRGVYDDQHKRRHDCEVTDPALLKEVHRMLVHRLRPLIAQAFNFDATRLERNIVACYSAEERGFFRPHRDNTTLATAHRRFAVTLNLNSEDHEGGELRFPEFSSATYRAPTGGAVVFSCALLHEATEVTRGVRYAFLPFLYGEAEAGVRVAGRRFLDDSAEG